MSIHRIARRRVTPFALGLVLIAVAACAAPPSTDDSPAVLAGTNWTLRSLAGGDVTTPSPTLSFEEAGRVGGNAGVNRFGGEASIEGRSLRLGPLMTTRMAGPPDRMELERRYLEALADTNRWSIVDGRLELFGPDGLLATFVSASPAPR